MDCERPRPRPGPGIPLLCEPDIEPVLLRLLIFLASSFSSSVLDEHDPLRFRTLTSSSSIVLLREVREAELPAWSVLRTVNDVPMFSDSGTAITDVWGPGVAGVLPDALESWRLRTRLWLFWNVQNFFFSAISQRRWRSAYKSSEMSSLCNKRKYVGKITSHVQVVWKKPTLNVWTIWANDKFSAKLWSCTHVWMGLRLWAFCLRYNNAIISCWKSCCRFVRLYGFDSVVWWWRVYSCNFWFVPLNRCRYNHIFFFLLFDFSPPETRVPLTFWKYIELQYTY